MDPLTIVGGITLLLTPLVSIGIGVGLRGMAANEAEKRHVAETALNTRIHVEQTGQLVEARKTIAFLEEQLKNPIGGRVEKVIERNKIIDGAASPDDAALLLLAAATPGGSPAGSGNPTVSDPPDTTRLDS